MKAISTKIYAADVTELNDEALYRAAYQKVTDERRKKTDGYRFSQDRLLSLGAELLLMQGLERLGMNLHEMSYRYGPNGKPYLTGGRDVHFNISHSGELVICAISPQEIGCDVEKISDVNLTIAKRFFSTAEFEKMAAEGTAERKQDMFFRLWTLKESYIKMTGQGMSLPLDSFCIQLDKHGISVKQEMGQKTYYFQEFDAGKNYKCSVCGADPGIGDEKGIVLERLNFSVL